MSAATPKTRHAGASACGLLLLAASALAGCETTAGGGGSGMQASQPPMPITRQEAAAQCWMGTEKGHADMPLDKRADIVTKCIDQKMGKADAKPAPKT
jgi:hypothetical protein